ncbi:hypothetical protein FJ958_05860 [Mesorhizobium sp. B2-3-5]|nr:hypothetical protein FJ958_05860 [Mesorhizobium sp. B2-3-5]
MVVSAAGLHAVPPTFEISRNASRFVILGRSKERSDAAQTLGSMPRPQRVTTEQNSAPLHPSTNITAWIPGSPRRPGMTKSRTLFGQHQRSVPTCRPTCREKQR